MRLALNSHTFLLVYLHYQFVISTITTLPESEDLSTTQLLPHEIVRATEYKAMPTITNLSDELYNACAQNDLARVNTLTSDPGFTSWPAAAVAAASNGATDVAAFCVRDAHAAKGPSILDRTLLYIRAREDTDQAYRFLVESSLVDVNYIVDRTGPLLGLIIGDSRYPGRHALARYLLEKGADPNQAVDVYSGDRIITAAATRSRPAMLELLIQGGARLDDSGALTAAAEGGNIENVKFLLTQDTDVNEMIRMSYHPAHIPSRPLHLAVQNGHLELVDTLLAAGADITAKDSNGKTALDIAVVKGIDEGLRAKLS